MAAASESSNTVCQAVTACEMPLHFEAVSATATSDAVCQPVTQCSIDPEQTAAPTRTTDRVCKAVADNRIVAPDAASDSAPLAPLLCSFAVPAVACCFFGFDSR